MVTAILLVIALLVVLLGATAAVLRIPVHRWTFEHHGHRVTIRDYLFHEVIAVDGADQLGTRIGGDRMTYAQHTLGLPDGSQLRVWISLTENRWTCRVDDGAQIVFDTAHGPPLLEPPARAPPEEDPRLAAARVLLADVTAVDPEAGAALGAALEQVVLAEKMARANAEAHAVLGGDPDDTSALVDERRVAVDELLATLRTLHLQVSAAHDLDGALADAREASARIAASTEVARATSRIRRVTER